MATQKLREILREWLEVGDGESVDDYIDHPLNPLLLWSAIVNGSGELCGETDSAGSLLTRLGKLVYLMDCFDSLSAEEKDHNSWKDLSRSLIEDEEDPSLNHWFTLLNPESPEEQKQQSAEYLAEQIWGNRISAKSPKARTGIKRLREKFVCEKTLLVLCVLEAISDSRDLQPIRLGRTWVKKGKRISQTVPLDLSRCAYQIWLAQHSRQRLEQQALDEAQSEALEYWDNVMGYKEDDAIRMLDKETKHDLLSHLDNMKSRLAPQLQAYLEHEQIAYQENPMATETQLRASVCRTMGITENHARQIKHQIFKKLSKSY